MNYRSERHHALDENSCSSCVKCPVPQACEVSDEMEVWQTLLIYLIGCVGAAIVLWTA